MKLSPEQIQPLQKVPGCVLTDAFYTTLMALDGAASLGGSQLFYELRDEQGNQLTGELERLGWECFHNDNL